MKIAILVPTLKGYSDGLLKHLNSIVPLLSDDGKVTDITVVHPRHIVLKELDGAVRRHVVPWYDILLGFWNMARFVHTNKFDVAFTLTTRSILQLRLPVVTLAQNIEPFQQPTYWVPLHKRLKLMVQKYEARMACRRADHVIAVSRHLKEVLVRSLRIPETSISVVYHGYDADEHSASVQPPFPIPSQFLFASGSFSWYRGFEDLLTAIALLREKNIAVPTLLLTAPVIASERGYYTKIMALIDRLGLRSAVIITPYLRPEEMTWCFRNATMFVQTSRAEAFSNTQLEAMGQGCLTVCSDYPVMREIFDDTAFYYSTNDPGSLADQIMRVLQLPSSEILELRRRLQERMSRFSWESTVRQTIEILHRVRRGSTEHQKS